MRSGQRWANGRILDDLDLTPGERVAQLRGYAEAEGLQPPPPPIPLPPIDEEDVRLVAWVAVAPSNRSRAVS